MIEAGPPRRCSVEREEFRGTSEVVVVYIGGDLPNTHLQGTGEFPTSRRSLRGEFFRRLRCPPAACIAPRSAGELRFENNYVYLWEQRREHPEGPSGSHTGAAAAAGETKLN